VRPLPAGAVPSGSGLITAGSNSCERISPLDAADPPTKHHSNPARERTRYRNRGRCASRRSTRGEAIGSGRVSRSGHEPAEKGLSVGNQLKPAKSATPACVGPPRPTPADHPLITPFGSAPILPGCCRLAGGDHAGRDEIDHSQRVLRSSSQPRLETTLSSRRIAQSARGAHTRTHAHEVRGKRSKKIWRIKRLTRISRPVHNRVES
jgi:hypothetical protein